MADEADLLRDVGEADFDREVLARSHDVPVVVDFWAPWCGPCGVLGPLLERLADEHRGELVLTRVDVDQAPGVAQRYGVRAIPTVLGFREGALVAEFQGAQPEPAVRRFLDTLLPTPADRRAGLASDLAAAGDLPGAEAAFREALAGDPRHAKARLGLAKLLAGRGETGEASKLLEGIVGSPAVEQEAERLAAALRTDSVSGDEAHLAGRVSAHPEDLTARLDLGRLLAARHRYEEALSQLLAVVERDRDFADEAARKAMLDIFAVLGSDHPLTERFRSALAAALFR